MTENTYRYTTYQRQTVWESLISNIVKITWRHIDPREEPWERYRVMDADCEWIKLQGMDRPNKVRNSFDPYEGGPIVVRLSDIDMAEIVE